jgi:quercetin dioxygenase-like cupin family protein
MKAFLVMTPLAVCIAIGVGGLTLAPHGEHDKGGVKTLSRKDIIEKIDAKKAKATTVKVTLGPGEASAPHRHPGPAFGYVLEGEYEWAIDDNPAKILKVGDTFYVEESQQEGHDACRGRGAARRRRGGHRHP